MVKVKICGLKDPESVGYACEYGADYLGFILIGGTPRFLDNKEAAALVKGIPGKFRKNMVTVGLFRNQSIGKVSSAVAECSFDMVQLQGEESPEDCAFIKKETGCLVAKAFKVGSGGLVLEKYSLADYGACDYFMFDTYHAGISGGTGETFEWGKLSAERSLDLKPFFVAGGLNPLNVKMAIEATRPYGVDVSSGVETSPGKKDKRLLKEFIKNAKEL
ncbi:MAG TPA: phosphoribosylanthranilate isomerase [Candidatus Omnitrophota bacterium]|nr:phosphoribosylanthranilate isomerase [Candidatus Omnitrophota bacterium]